MKKLISILLLLSLLLCVASCNTPQNEPEDTTPQADAGNVYGTTYEVIIARYSALLHEKINNETEALPNNAADEIEVALCGIVNDCTDPSAMGYATKDINRDGTDELVLLNKSNKLYALFTIRNGTPILLLNMNGMSATITPDGTVYARKIVEGVSSCTYVQQIVDGGLEGLEYGYLTDGETVTRYKVDNGVRAEITDAEIWYLDEYVSLPVSFNSRYYCKTTGFRFVPAVTNSTVGVVPPVPDFSTYDGILSAYRTIVESFCEYTQADWTDGKFDALFSISDNEAYEVFHQIYYGGIRVRPTQTYYGQEYDERGNDAYGYAKKDLNRDGVEELILLNDNYRIIAIFTMKDGEAVLIDGTYDVYLDENGTLRKKVYTDGTVSRDNEVYVYEINGTELKTVVGVGYKVNVYLQKEGWYRIDKNGKTPISDAEGNALYAEYDIVPSGYSNSEYTRTVAGLDFIPLFAASLATPSHIDTYSRAQFISESTVTVTACSDHDVTVSIKFVDAVGEYDPETNGEPEVYELVIEGTAVRDGIRYGFEMDGIKGYVEFAVNSVWVIVTESANEHVDCRAYLFDRPEGDIV